MPLRAQVEGGQAYINLVYTRVLLDRLKNGGSVEPHKIPVEEVCSGNTAALGAEELEAAAKFQEGLLSVLEKKKNTDDGSLSEITALSSLAHKLHTVGSTPSPTMPSSHRFLGLSLCRRT